MDTKQIFLLKQHGDIVIVAKVIGESHANTDRIIRRPNSKKHKKAMSVLAKIIEDREQSMTSAKEMIDNN